MKLVRHCTQAIVLIVAATSACKKDKASQAMTDSQTCGISGSGNPQDALTEAAATNCDPNPEKMMLDKGCFNRGRTIIAEKDNKQARKIDVFQCSPVTGTNDFDIKTSVFFSHPDELISFDKNTSLHNFYKLKGVTYEFQGDSFSNQNKCRECHAYGELVMKELPDPWHNWIGRSVSAEVQEIVGKDLTGQPRRAIEGTVMETIVKESINLVADGYASRTKSGAAPLENITVKEVLKPLFCETGVTILDKASGNPFNPHNFIFLPRSPLVSIAGQFMAPGPGSKLPKLPNGEQYASENGLEIPTAYGPAIGESFIQAKVVSQLVSTGVIEESLPVAAALVDWPNAIFSTKRCGIWKQIPETKMSEVQGGKAVNEMLLSELANSDNADVQEFVANLKKSSENLNGVKDEFKTRLGTFLAKCKEEGSAISQIEKFYPLYRSKLIPYLQTNEKLKFFEKLAIIEHEPLKANSPSSMFSESQKIFDGAYAKQEGLGLTEDCQLNMSL
ncbi:MAG: hypothetical protein AB7T49_16815 [Oligoflexales bacterium]